MRPRGTSTSIRELNRTHNGRPVRIDVRGYAYIYEPTFSADRQWRSLPRGWHFEHRVIAAQMLGRPLRCHEEVHHINGDKTDNQPTNLEVLTKKAHRKLHNDEIAEKLRRLAEYERRFGPLLNVADADALDEAERALRRIGSLKES